ARTASPSLPLFPYTTLFRSRPDPRQLVGDLDGRLPPDRRRAGGHSDGARRDGPRRPLAVAGGRGPRLSDRNEGFGDDPRRPDAVRTVPPPPGAGGRSRGVSRRVVHARSAADPRGLIRWPPTNLPPGASPCVPS